MTERRLYPRYDCSFQVRLVDKRQQPHLVSADNISLNGIALKIDQQIKQAFLEQGCHLLAGDSVDMYLPDPGASGRPDRVFSCRIQYLRRLSQQHYQLGAFFDQADAQQQDVLQALVEQNKVL